MRFLAMLLGLALATPPVLAAGPAVPTQAQLHDLPSRIVVALVARDVRTMRTLCTPVAYVVNEFPPFLWTGADACARFARDFAALAKRAHLTAMSATTVKTSTTHVGDRLYVVTRVTLTPEIVGEPKPEDGTWTFVMMRSTGGWKIASMTWSTISP